MVSTQEKKSKPNFETMFENLEKEYKELKVHFHKVGETMRKLQQTHNNELKKTMRKKNKTDGERKLTGFAVPKLVPDKFADFLKIQRGTLLAGKDVTKLVWARFDELGLVDKTNRRLLRTNAEVSDIFGVDMAVNKITDAEDKNGFNFRNIQTHIKYAMNQPAVTTRTSTPPPRAKITAQIASR